MKIIDISNVKSTIIEKKENERCIQECTRSIELDPTYIKPLSRRAECRESADKLDEALEDYKKLAELQPNVEAHRRKCFVSVFSSVLIYTGRDPL